MRIKKSVFVLLLVLMVSRCLSQQKNLLPAQFNLPNGWSLTPAVKRLPLGDLHLNIAVSPTKKFIAITNNGQSTQSIQLIDVLHEKLLDSIDIAKSWLGLKFGNDE